jgi:hypothetical protein
MHTTDRTSNSEVAPEARSRGAVALMIAVAGVATLIWVAALVVLAGWLIADLV